VGRKEGKASSCCSCNDCRAAEADIAHIINGGTFGIAGDGAVDSSFADASFGTREWRRKGHNRRAYR
jgi:hypothetical protein